MREYLVADKKFGFVAFTSRYYECFYLRDESEFLDCAKVKEVLFHPDSRM